VLAAVAGSCTLPVAAFAEPACPDEPDGALRLTGLLASGDGRTVVRQSGQGEHPEALGAAVGRALLEGGGAAIEGFAVDAPSGDGEVG